MGQEEDKGEVDGLTIIFWDPYCSAIFLFTDLYAVCYCEPTCCSYNTAKSTLIETLQPNFYNCFYIAFNLWKANIQKVKTKYEQNKF